PQLYQARRGKGDEAHKMGIHSFLSSCSTRFSGYYRKHIENFAEVSRPLTELFSVA
ncbi:hypothetical protein VP01_11836g1, partial [Puccinia sorghi]